MTRLGLLLVSVALALPACIDEPCDPGYHAIRGACFADEADAATGDDEDAGDDTAAACEPPYGKTCDPDNGPDDQCGCDTECIPVLKLCSSYQCMPDIEDGPACPEDGWTCLDLAGMNDAMPELTSLCVNS